MGFPFVLISKWKLSCVVDLENGDKSKVSGTPSPSLSKSQALGKPSPSISREETLVTSK